ncbi:MAG: hypothetical protein GXO39_03265 [Thermotogae bacterium]|nr:hypothetical protein [Thermotogota bacterium]
MRGRMFAISIVFLIPSVLSGQVVADYEPPSTPDFYRPYKLFIGSTADVLAAGTFWLYGGAFFMNWAEYGIGQGVFNVGVADVLEIKLSAGRLLSNLSTGGTNEFATAMRIRVLNLKGVKLGVELRLAPVITQKEVDTLVIFNNSLGKYDFFRVDREFNSRSATLFVPLSFYYRNLTFALGGSITQYGTTIKFDPYSYLPDTANNCGGPPDDFPYDCDSLKAIYSSPAFRPSGTEERSTFYGGYAGVIYRWKPTTEIVAEIHMFPRVIYRTRPKDLSDTLSPVKRWSLENRYTENTFSPVILSFFGMRYSFNRYLSIESSIVLPYDTRYPNSLDLLNAMIHANLNLIFSMEDVTRWLGGG